MDDYYSEIKQKILDLYYNNEKFCILNSDEIEELAVIIGEHSLFKERIYSALEAYQQTDGQGKYAAACKELGFNTGKKEKKINSEEFFQDYIRLITAGDLSSDDMLFQKKVTDPLTKREALEKLAEKYNFYNTAKEPYNAAYQYLKRILQEKKKNLNDKKHNLNNLLPPDWPEI